MIVSADAVAPSAPTGQPGIRVRDRRVLERERPLVEGDELARMLLLTVHAHARWRTASQWAYEVAVDHAVEVKARAVERLLEDWTYRWVLEREAAVVGVRVRPVYRMRRSS